MHTHTCIHTTFNYWYEMCYYIYFQFIYQDSHRIMCHLLMRRIKCEDHFTWGGFSLDFFVPPLRDCMFVVHSIVEKSYQQYLHKTMSNLSKKNVSFFLFLYNYYSPIDSLYFLPKFVGWNNLSIYYGINSIRWNVIIDDNNLKGLTTIYIVHVFNPKPIIFMLLSLLLIFFFVIVRSQMSNQCLSLS